jgi:hypothetical protein
MSAARSRNWCTRWFECTSHAARSSGELKILFLSFLLIVFLQVLKHPDEVGLDIRLGADAAIRGLRKMAK